MAEETKEAAPEPVSPAAQLAEEYQFPDLKAEAAKAEAQATEAKQRDAKGRFLKKEEVQAAAPPEPKPEAPKIAHSKFLTRQALEVGVSEEEIAETPSDELRDYVREKQYQRMIERQMGPTQPLQPKAGAESPAAETADVDLGLGELASDLDPRIVTLLKNLTNKVAGMEKHLIGKVQEENTNRFERALAKHADIFGTGTIDELDKDGPEMAKRNMAALQVQNWKGQPGSLESKIDKIATAIRGGEPAAHAPSAAAPSPKPATNGNGVNRVKQFTPEEWEEGTVAKPNTHNGSPEPKGVKLAKKTFEKGMAALQSSGERDEDENAFS